MESVEYIQVSNEWLQKAKQYGTEREAQNGGNDTPAYAHGKPLPYSSLTASRLAVVGEVGAHLYFGVAPESTHFVVKRGEYASSGLKANADLTYNGRKIEVRNSTDPNRPLPIKEKDVEAEAIVVQVHVQMADGKPTGRVYFIGWADAVKDYARGRHRAGTSYKSLKRNMADLEAYLNA